MNLPAAVIAACVLATAPALASERHDHDRARTALLAGEIQPLDTVLQRVAQQHPGQVLEVELERDDGRWIYEIKLLQPGGALLKLEVDAASGQVLKARQRRREGR